jgi:plastocyanin
MEAREAQVSRSRSRTLLAAATALALVMALSVMADAAPSHRSATRGTITTIRGVAGTYSDPHWSPKKVKIDSGSRVKWLAVNFDHHIVAYGGNWTFNHQLPEGSSVSRKFAHAGTYLFRCTIHSTLMNGHCEGMCGKVVAH